MKGYMYILLCSNGLYYTGSTKYLHLRLAQHQAGEGANFTRKHLPVLLLYYEVYNRIDTAYYREKQIQGWSRKKKEALMRGDYDRLSILAQCENDTHYKAFRLRSIPKNGLFPSTLNGEQLIYDDNFWDFLTDTGTESEEVAP
jgi:putative endonuclease